MREAVEEAVWYAFNTVGLEVFKQTSLFGSNKDVV